MTPHALSRARLARLGEIGRWPSNENTSGPSPIRGCAATIARAAFDSGRTKSTFVLFLAAGNSQSVPLISDHGSSVASFLRHPVSSKKRMSAWNGCAAFPVGSVAVHSFFISSSFNVRDRARSLVLSGSCPARAANETRRTAMRAN